MLVVHSLCACASLPIRSIDCVGLVRKQPTEVAHYVYTSVLQIVGLVLGANGHICQYWGSGVPGNEHVRIRMLSLCCIYARSSVCMLDMLIYVLCAS